MKKTKITNDISEDIYISPSLLTEEKDLETPTVSENIMRIVIILDRSGSMFSIRKATIDNFNKYIDSQKVNKDITILVTLALFDDFYEVVYEDKNINDVEPLTETTYVPRGCTALYDAIGKSLQLLTEKVNKTKAKIQATLIVIITDGENNASKEYTQESIKVLVEEKTKDSWEFVYLGANQDAILVAKSMNIKSGNSMSYSANEASVGETFFNMSSASYRYATRSFAGMPEESVRGISFFNPDEQDTTKATTTSDTLKINNIQSITTIGDNNIIIQGSTTTLDITLPKGLKTNLDGDKN